MSSLTSVKGCAFFSSLSLFPLSVFSDDQPRHGAIATWSPWALWPHYLPASPWHPPTKSRPTQDEARGALTLHQLRSVPFRLCGKRLRPRSIDAGKRQSRDRHRTHWLASLVPSRHPSSWRRCLHFINGRCISRQLGHPWHTKTSLWPLSARRHEGEFRYFPGFSKSNQIRCSGSG